MGNRANPVYTQTRRLSGRPSVAGRLHLSADKPIIAQRATELIEPLARIHADMLEAPCLHRAELEVVHPRNLRSALNLLQYLALRRHNLGEVQARLAELGLSSLGRSEAHALTTLQAVMHALYALSGRSEPPFQTDAVGFVEGSRLLRAHADELLVASPEGRNTRIMVTMPSEAADDYELVHALVRNGMDVMRINCAHDDAAKWKRMARNLRKAARATGRRCKVEMDLAGPKLRTGAIEPGEAILKLAPRRDSHGRVIQPARLLLVTGKASSTLPSHDARSCVTPELLRAVKPGSGLKLRDLRSSKRILLCTAAGRGWRLLETDKTCYLGNEVQVSAGTKRGQLKGIPQRPGKLRLKVGELLVLTADQKPGRLETRRIGGKGRRLAVVPCTLPEVIPQVRPNEPIWFDDGKIGGRVVRTGSSELLVEITQAGPEGSDLAADKGINLPSSRLRLAALTAKDRQDLAVAVRNADIVGMSFVNHAADIQELHNELTRLGADHVGVLLKIETRSGFANLPAILLTALRRRPVGVMIARGDLAVECGFERMAEVQEEMLWICEAAHVPVVWATQVLETLAKKGAPSRAEITDAAMGERAECVMLNKGPHVARAVSVLDDILRRMEGHQAKKSSILRRLHVAQEADEV